MRIKESESPGSKATVQVGVSVLGVGWKGHMRYGSGLRVIETCACTAAVSHGLVPAACTTP